MIRKLLLATASLLLVVSSSHALDVATHGRINRYILQNSTEQVMIDTYVKDTLGISNGIGELFIGEQNSAPLAILARFELGGVYEDQPPGVLPYLRSINHFHNPVTDKGFSGIWNVPIALPGQSALVWAQQAASTQAPGGYYSWVDARDNFYRALTAKEVLSRFRGFADAFRGVGQVMHLVQDMSAPEHARDDGHYTDAYEEWLADATNARAITVVNTALANPIYPDRSLLGTKSSPFPSAPVPIANLFDSEQYNGTNPGGTVALTYGLSEYSSANFFSADTIFTSGFPYPAYASVEEYDQQIDSSGKKRTYLRKTADGERVEHLATGRWFYKYLPTAMKSSGHGLKLDENVYEDYAKLLLPRAVGYSAASLEYFFRGKLSVVEAERGVHFRSVTVNVHNDTAGETMGIGQAKLVIRYKPLAQVALAGGIYLMENPSEGTAQSDFSYLVSKPIVVDMSTPQQLTFDFSEDVLPYAFGDITMQMIFKGRLGNEEGAVAVSPLRTLTGVYSDFDVSLPRDGVYAKSDEPGENASFSEVRVAARTDLPGGLSGGVFKLALEYSKATTDPFQSHPVDSAPSDALSYLTIVENQSGVTTLQQGEPAELIFDLSNAPLPVWATDVYLNVLYIDPATSRPRAIGFRDISEPTPVDVFNNADKICINGQWMAAGSTDAITLAGRPETFDPYAHNIADILIKASSSVDATPVSETQFSFSSPDTLAGGAFRRLGYILTDYQMSYSEKERWIGTDQDDLWIAEEVVETRTGTAVKNQTDAGGYTWPSMINIRGNQLWWGTGLIWDNKSYGAGSCSWSDRQ